MQATKERVRTGLFSSTDVTTGRHYRRSKENDALGLRGSVGRSRRSGHMDALDLLDEAMVYYTKDFGSEPIDWKPGLGFAETRERSREGVQIKRNIAHAFIDAGRPERAGELLDQVNCSTLHGDLSARAYLALGRPGEALAFFRREYGINFWNEGYSNDPVEFARDEGEYGLCLARTGHHREAERMLLQAHARAVSWAGPHSRLVTTLCGCIASMYRERGDRALAAQWERRAGGPL